MSDVQRIAQLEAEIANLKRFVADTCEGMDCIEGCDSYGHSDNCPVAYPIVAFRKLRDENEKLWKALDDAIRRPMGVVPASASELGFSESHRHHSQTI